MSIKWFMGKMSFEKRVFPNEEKLKEIMSKEAEELNKFINESTINIIRGNNTKI